MVYLLDYFQHRRDWSVSSHFHFLSLSKGGGGEEEGKGEGRGRGKSEGKVSVSNRLIVNSNKQNELNEYKV